MRQANAQLVSRVAEMQAEVTIHKAKIAELERENVELKAEIEQLKARGRKPVRKVAAP
jgi:cell division protein FtsB